MKAIQSATALTSALVHPSAERPASRLAAHQAFLAEKLLFSAATLAAAPFYLLYHGAPTFTGAVIFALALLQVAAAMAVAQTGRLIVGQMASACGFAGIALALASQGVVPDTLPGSAVGVCWLGVAVFEAASSFNKRIYGAASLIMVLALCAILVQTVGATTGIDATLVAGTALVAMLAIGHRAVASNCLAGRQAERQLARDRAMARALGNPVIEFDAEGLVDDASSECENLLGVTRKDIVGRGLFEHVHVADRPAYLKLVADAAGGAETQIAQLRLRSGVPHIGSRGRPEPRHVWVEMRAHRMAVAENQPAGAIAVLRDISAERQQSVEIDTAKASVNDAIRSKDEFLANMSHELRTPLNAIIGFSEMLGSQTMRPIEAEKQREYARIIHQSGQHLLSVVNSILDMSKIQSGSFPLLPEPFEIAPLIEQCCDMMHLKAEAGSIQIVCDVPPDLSEIVGDKRACKQILINLLSNAVKFTPEHGVVTVRARLEGTSICITVADTGIGISEADLARLGLPFFQARGSLCRPYEGTGLGLSVVRGLLGLHGGSITIASELGKGTNVAVRLPSDCRAVTRSTSAMIDFDTRRSSGGTARGSDATRPSLAQHVLEPGLKLSA